MNLYEGYAVYCKNAYVYTFSGRHDYLKIFHMFTYEKRLLFLSFPCLQNDI